ncbi:MAG: glycosyltransferase family 2 protein [Verrucomicrobiota bacterium]
MTPPKVSVCIPTYNYARYLPEAIESILNQNFTNFELLIIDDCSKDNTAEVVQRYAAQDSRVLFSVNSPNVGMVNNWNLCLQRARGEYIKYVFGDDVLCSRDALSKMMEPLAQNPSVSLVASARKIIDNESRFSRTRSSFRKSLIMPGDQAIRRCVFEQKNLIGEPTVVMFRKADAGRGFNARYRQIVDLEMWYHLLEKGRLVYLTEPLCAFRCHPDQQSEHNSRSNVTLDDMVLIFEDYLAKPYLHFGALDRRRIAYDYCYFVWKYYRKKTMTRAEAEQRINDSLGFGKFRAWLPFYKIARPCMKLSRHLARRFGRQQSYP